VSGEAVIVRAPMARRERRNAAVDILRNVKKIGRF
jgi:hypothetical protein